MKNQSRLIKLGIMMLTVFMLASCTSNKSNLTAVPKDAGFVMVVDGNALATKAGVQDFTQTKAYKKLLINLSDDELSHLSEFEYILKDPNESGLGIKKEFLFFVKVAGNEPTIGFDFSIIDRSKVDALMKRVIDDESTDLVIEEDASISTMLLANNEGIFAWDDHQFIILANEDIAPEALVNEAKKLLQQDNNESINANKAFSEFYKKKKDISIWFDYDMISKNMPPAQQMMIASQIPFNMTGTSFDAYISFEKGKVVAEYESVLNDEMKKYMENYKFINDEFDTDILQMLPKLSYANAEISINLFDYYQMIMDMYKEKQMDTEQYTKQLEVEIGMSIDDLLHSISGDMAISLHGIHMAEKTRMSYAINDEGEFEMKNETNMEPELLYSAVIRFNDRKAWDLIEAKADKMGLKKVDSYYSIPQANMFLAYIDNTMLITNDSVLLAKDIAKGSINPNLASTDVSKYLNKFPSYLEVNMDLDEYPEDVKSYIESRGDKEYTSEILKLLKTYKRFQIIPTNVYGAKLVLELKDQTKNSLEVILHNADEASDIISQK